MFFFRNNTKAAADNFVLGKFLAGLIFTAAVALLMRRSWLLSCDNPVNICIVIHADADRRVARKRGRVEVGNVKRRPGSRKTLEILSAVTIISVILQLVSIVMVSPSLLFHITFYEENAMGKDYRHFATSSVD